MEVDLWFRLWDLRRVVADDTPGVIEELLRLGNTRYHGRPVSLWVVHLTAWVATARWGA